MTQTTASKSRGLGDTIQGIAVLATCAFLVYQGINSRKGTAPSVPIPKSDVSLKGATTVGNSSAPVVLVIYSDYECPYCGRFAREVWPQLQTDYVDTNKMRVAYRQVPIEKLHRNARIASVAALCADTLGNRFADMDRLLFQDQKRLDRPSLLERADHLGLNRDEFDRCLDGPLQARVSSDSSAATLLGMVSTPSFFVGLSTQDGVSVLERIKGAQSLDTFRKSIDGALLGRGWMATIRRTFGFVR